MIETSQQGFDRLTVLKDRLKAGQLTQDNFKFNIFHEERINCGTAGCAVGECPGIWPDLWKYDHENDPVLISPKSRMAGIYPNQAAMEFFQINDAAFQHLFLPEEQDLNIFGGNFLREKATPEQVGANIEEFLKRCTVKEAACP